MLADPAGGVQAVAGGGGAGHDADPDPQPEPPMPTVAELYLKRLKRRGIDYVFANAGTDFAPLIEALSGAGPDPDTMPQPIIVPHETATVAMAQGYYLATGRPQALMTHVNVGLANALMGVINAARENLPMLVTSGRTPITESGRLGSRDFPIHWGQEMRDQGAMLREFVKWDYELRFGEQVPLAVDRALAMTMAEPRGPVYLSLPREVLAQEIDAETLATADLAPILDTPSAPMPDPAAIERAAAILAAAEAPLVVTARAGRDPAAIPILERLAERFALPVKEFWSTDVSLSSTHPMHAGFGFEFPPETDAVLVIDTMVPWVPTRPGSVPAGARVIQLGPDPLFQAAPMRGFPAEVAVTTSVAAGLAALEAALERTDLEQRVSTPARYARLAETNAAARDARLTAAQPHADGVASKAFVSRCLDEARDGATVFVDELGVDRGAMTLDRPRSFFGLSIAGGLGWGLGGALGVKLAAPESTVIATVGDGCYMFSNPVACHQIAAANGLPFLTVVFNNGVWNAVRASTLNLYPDGAAARANRMPLTSLEPAPAYEQVAAASGAHAERVETADALPGAIDRALKAVRDDKRQALLNVYVR